MENISLKKINQIIYTGGLGFLIFLITLYGGWAVYPFLINKEIRSRMVLNNGTTGMEILSLPHHWIFSVYLYNVTNPQEVVEGIKPIIEETGPYVYDHYRTKTDFKFGDDDTISYRMKTMFYFNANKSGSNEESDIVTVLNVPLLEILYFVEETLPEALITLPSTISLMLPDKETLFISAPVGDILFNGIRVVCGNKTDHMQLICEKINIGLFPSFKQISGTRDFSFSYFQKDNSSLSSMITINRGNSNFHYQGMMVAYEGHKWLKMWEKNTSCSEISGTDWTVFPPCYSFPDPKQLISIFFTEMCLALQYFKVGQQYSIDDVPMSVYMLSMKSFYSYKENPRHKCRCKQWGKNSTIPQKCAEKGVIDATRCQGEPFVYSFPRFIYSDYKDVNASYKSSPEIETIVILEPRTGLPMLVVKRLQRNIFLRRMEIKPLSNVSDILFPLCWTKETYSEELEDTYRESIGFLKSADRQMMSICGALFAVGGLLFLSSLFMYLKIKHQIRIDPVVLLFQMTSDGRNGYQD